MAAAQPRSAGRSASCASCPSTCSCSCFRASGLTSCDTAGIQAKSGGSSAPKRRKERILRQLALKLPLGCQPCCGAWGLTSADALQASRSSSRQAKSGSSSALKRRKERILRQLALKLPRGCHPCCAAWVLTSADALQASRSSSRQAKGGSSSSAPKRRKERILRQLALKPPPGSPFADQLCLAGAEQLIIQVSVLLAVCSIARPCTCTWQLTADWGQAAVLAAESRMYSL